MANLPTNELGRTGMQVTRLGYGAMELRGASGRGGPSDRSRAVTPEQAEAVLNAVLDAGINFIDTSPDYGMSEELIGRFISHRRSEYFLASKCGCLVAVGPDPSGRGPRHVYTRENVVAGVEQSLARMRTDHLDLVQFHGNPSREQLREHGAVEALRELQQAGKVHFIGSSSTLPELAGHIEGGVFDAFQIPYSAIQREHEDAIGEAAAAGAGTVIRGGAARGIAADDKDWGARLAGMQQGEAQGVWERASLDDLLEGASRMEFTLRFTLSHPQLNTTIVGTANPDHLAMNVAAADRGPLPADVYEEAKRRLSGAASAPAAASD